MAISSSTDNSLFDVSTVCALCVFDFKSHSLRVHAKEQMKKQRERGGTQEEEEEEADESVSGAEHSAQCTVYS